MANEKEKRVAFVNVDQETHTWIVADEHWKKSNEIAHGRALMVQGSMRQGGLSLEQALEAALICCARMAGHNHEPLPALLETFTQQYRMEEARAHVREKAEAAIAAQAAQSVTTTLPNQVAVESVDDRWN